MQASPLAEARWRPSSTSHPARRRSRLRHFPEHASSKAAEPPDTSTSQTPHHARESHDSPRTASGTPVPRPRKHLRWFQMERSSSPHRSGHASAHEQSPSPWEREHPIPQLEAARTSGTETPPPPPQQPQAKIPGPNSLIRPRHSSTPSSVLL